MVEVSARAILDLGIETLGFSKHEHDKMKNERFCASFGIDPIACNIIFCDLQTVDIGNATIKQIDPYYFLMTLFWLRNYMTNIVMAGVFHIDDKTLSKWVWIYTYGVRALKETKVRKEVNIQGLTIYQKGIFTILLTISPHYCRSFGTLTTTTDWIINKTMRFLLRL